MMRAAVGKILLISILAFAGSCFPSEVEIQQTRRARVVRAKRSCAELCEAYSMPMRTIMDLTDWSHSYYCACKASEDCTVRFAVVLSSDGSYYHEGAVNVGLCSAEPPK